MSTSFIELLLEHWIAAALLVCVAAGVLTSIAKQIRKYACHRSEVELKRDLVERGLSADEIERVVAARLPDSKGSGSSRC